MSIQSNRLIKIRQGRIPFGNKFDKSSVKLYLVNLRYFKTDKKVKSTLSEH